MMRYILLAVITVALLSGCGEKYQTESLIKEINSKLAEEKDELKSLNRSLDWNIRELNSLYSKTMSLRASASYDKVAISGTAGTTEALIAIKKRIDSPAYDINQSEQLSRAEREIERLEKNVDYKKDELKKQEEKVASLEASLGETKAKLKMLEQQR